MSNEQEAAGKTLTDALARVAFQVAGILTRIGAENDLSLTHLRAFGALRDRPLRATELAAYLGLDKSTISGLINRAETRGLLVRAKNSDDRRVVDVILTPAGHELTARIHAEMRRELESKLSILSDEQREELHDLLRLAVRE